MNILKYIVVMLLFATNYAYAATSKPNPNYLGITLDSNPILKSCNGLLFGMGTSNAVCSKGTSSQILLGGNSLTWGQLNLSTMVTGTLGGSNGGTGLTSFTRSGTTTKFSTMSGTFSVGSCLTVDSNGNVVDGGTCGSGGANIQVDELTVTGTDTVSNLSLTFAGNLAQLVVNGGVYTNVGATPAFTVAGNVITWSAANAGFSLTVGDSVYAVYTVAYGGAPSVGLGYNVKAEKLTVTATDTLSSTTSGFNGNFAQLIVNGVVYTNLGTTPAFTISGNTVTWSAANAGVSLEVSDVVYIAYSITPIPNATGAGVSQALITATNTANGLVTLNANGNLYIANNTYFASRNTSGTSKPLLGLDSLNSVSLLSAGNNLYINPNVNSITYLNFNNTSAVRVGDGTATTNLAVSKGSIGVKTNSPAYEIDVVGTVRATTFIGNIAVGSITGLGTGVATALAQSANGAIGVLTLDNASTPLAGQYATNLGNGSYFGFNVENNSGWKYQTNDYAYILKHAGNTFRLMGAASGLAGGTATLATLGYWDSSGNYVSQGNIATLSSVGVGTLTPAYALDVSGTINGTTFRVNGTAGYTGSKTAGSCVLTIQSGVITNITGC